jgi:predicted glycosyltransferase
MRSFSSPTDSIFTLTSYTETIQARRFLFYSHDGLGLGDVRRSLAIARELVEFSPGASVLLVTGAEEAESLGVPARVGILKLPGFQKRDDRASAGRLPLPRGEVRLLRQRLLAATAETFQPEVVLVEGHPLGVGGELGPALEIARAFGAQAVLGLSDVVDDPATMEMEWHACGTFERVEANYTRVLVFGQPDLLDPVRDHRFPSRVAELTSYCGYVATSTRGELGLLGVDDLGSAKGEQPHVLATAGDGADGLPLLETFVEAAASASWRATIVAGPECPPGGARRLESLAADAGVTFRGFVPSLISEFPSLDALVCMGGYNTLAGAVASGVPTVCVPRVEPRRDQLVRAKAFATRGFVRLLEPERLTADALSLEVDAALMTRAFRPHASLDLGGARRAAHHLIELASQRASRARSKALSVA